MNHQRVNKTRIVLLSSIIAISVVFSYTELSLAWFPSTSPMVSPNHQNHQICSPSEMTIKEAYIISKERLRFPEGKYSYYFWVRLGKTTDSFWKSFKIAPAVEVLVTDEEFKAFNKGDAVKIYGKDFCWPLLAR